MQFHRNVCDPDFYDSLDSCTVVESHLTHLALEIISNEMQRNLIAKGLIIVQFQTQLALPFLLEGYELIICTTINFLL